MLLFADAIIDYAPYKFREFDIRIQRAIVVEVTSDEPGI